MPNPFSKVKTGDRQRIPADAYNRFLDTADAVERSRLTGGAVPAAGFDTTLVTVRNDGEIALPRFGVCKLVDSVVSPTAQGWKDGVWMTAEPPDGGDAVFAVTLEPIPPGHIGKAIVDGVTCVQIDVTDESHTCASPNAGDVEMLGSDTSGVPILWKEAGTGVKWAYVLLGVACTGTGTTTTSTTTRPHHCLGTCRWECDANSQWVLVSHDCLDYYGLSGTGELAADGDEAMVNCSCAPPTFCCADCGTGLITETATPCVKGASASPVCPGTTTSTTTTSTTTGAGCTGCEWAWWKGAWLLRKHNCGGSELVPCYGCSQPASSGSDDCDVQATPCHPPPPPPPVYCYGRCLWYWMPDQNNVFDWVEVIVSPCAWQGVDECLCVPPTSPGSECGQPFKSGCYVPGATSTSTTLPPYTTTLPPGCTGYCQWVWSESEDGWLFTCSNCPAGCVCDGQPYYDGTADGEGAVTQCHPPTSTTSTSTTSTTTRRPCDGLCYWWCNNGVWQGLYDTCDGSDPNCQCWGGDTPQNQVCNPGDDFIGTESCKITTTTTTSTTSTTSTSTTTAPTEWYCYDLYDCGRVGSGEDCFGSTCSIHLGRECAVSPHNRCQIQVGTFHVYQWIPYSGPYADNATCVAGCPDPTTSSTTSTTTSSTTSTTTAAPTSTTTAAPTSTTTGPP